MHTTMVWVNDQDITHDCYYLWYPNFAPTSNPPYYSMANTMSGPSSISEIADYSLWGEEYNMGAFRADPTRWNKDWEKALRTRTAADVFSVMGRVYGKKMDGAEMIPIHTKVLTGTQEALVEIWATMEGKGGHFITAWLLLEEKERTKHLNKGFEDSYPYITGRQDARCLAPEITISALLKRNGKAFIELVETYATRKKGVGVGKPYFLPSEWWDKALKGPLKSFPQGLDEHTYELMTIRRNNFITNFLMCAAMSVFNDLGNGSTGMKPVAEFMQGDPSVAQVVGETLSKGPRKPILRCENCTKSPEEIGNGTFMVCSACKLKLDFTVHYCSPECQREDWRSHKKHCGKEKIAKKLPGTIHDPSWIVTHLPEEMRHIPRHPSGGYQLASVGFGNPANLPAYSPALQRQVNLLTADKDADYFLFDEKDRPIRFEITNQMLKAAFRSVRTEVLSSTEPTGVESLVEQILKTMQDKPGLSRRRIVAQFSNEFSRDVEGKLAHFERARQNSNITLLEGVSQGVSKFM